MVDLSPGVIFSPPIGGETPKSMIFPPLIRRVRGGNRGIFPPLIGRVRGGNLRYFPPNRGGNTDICPPQAENFEDFRGVFVRKTCPKCTQKRVFGTETPPECPKIFRLRRAYCYRNPFSNASKVYFFAPAAGHCTVFVFYACLQGASTQAQNSCFCPRLPKSLCFSFMLVYRALLDKHKTQTMLAHCRREKSTLEAFTKGIRALTPIHLYNVRKTYSKHTSSPQARKFSIIIRLYKVFTVYLGLFF